MRHFGKRSTGQYMRTINGGILWSRLESFLASVRLMLPNPPEKPFVCLWNIPTTKNAMPEQFPLDFDTQPNIHCKPLVIQ